MKKDQCVIYWHLTSPNSLEERTVYCCQALFDADNVSGEVTHVPHYTLAYRGKTIDKCPFCGAPIVAIEEKDLSRKYLEEWKNLVSRRRKGKFERFITISLIITAIGVSFRFLSLILGV